MISLTPPLRKPFALLGACLLISQIPDPTTVRANVFASDIKLNGSFTNLTLASGSQIQITYILNEPASRGVSINILTGGNAVRTLSAAPGVSGALRGTNSVLWDGKDFSSNNLPSGSYSVSITASATGFTNWTQTSMDTNKGNYVWYGQGISVDRNQTSPYYGRVFVANTSPGPNPSTTPGDGKGILKLNADGSPADESSTNWFTTGGYDWQLGNFSPWRLEVSSDDFVYINDFSQNGVVYRWDPTISSNSELPVLTITNWVGGASSSENLSGHAIVGSGTNTELWIADWLDTLGILKFRLTTNGVCATNDTGTTVVGFSNVANNVYYTPFDVALDQNRNIFTIQYLTDPSDPGARVFRFPAYNPATNGGAAEYTATWAVGGGDASYSGASGVAVDPTGAYVAVAFQGYQSGNNFSNGTTRVFSAATGALVADVDAKLTAPANVDNDCAWDAVGNLYYLHTPDGFATNGVWRAVSPPGTNQSTTIAPANLQITGGTVQRPQITSIAVSNGIVNITFTAAANDYPWLFTLQSANPVTGSFSDISGLSATPVSSGVFSFATPASGPNRFYRIRR